MRLDITFQPLSPLIVKIETVTPAALADINTKLHAITMLLTTLEQEVTENKDAVDSAIVLLNGLKAALDAAGTDAVKLKELSDSLSNQTDSLAEAIVANTPQA